MNFIKKLSLLVIAFLVVACVGFSATDATYEMNQGDTLSITLGSKGATGVVTYSIVGEPDNGEWSGDPPNIIYAPDAGFVGVDAFEFLASTVIKGEEKESTASVTITVNESSGEAGQVVSVVSDLSVSEESYALVSFEDQFASSCGSGDRAAVPLAQGDELFMALLDGGVISKEVLVEVGQCADVVEESLPTLLSVTVHHDQN